MKNFLKISLIATSAFLLARCGKEPVYNYTDDSMPPPAQVTNIQVKPTPGGGIITYSLPVDANLSYVKAVYEIQPGVKAEAKSSVFKDTLVVSGFGDISPRQITIYSVGKNEKASEPLTVDLVPLTPPVMQVQQSISLEPTFGGVRLRYRNPTRANLAFTLLYDTTGNGAYKEINSYYSALDSGTFSARGFDTLSKRFAVYVRDRWNNRSPQVEAVIKPLFEQFIPKTTWKAMYLPTDTYQYVESFDLPHVYDGSWGIGNYNIFATVHTLQIPQWFTLDLGKTVTASRMKVMHYHESPYAGASVKQFEIWGSNDPPANGSWDGWKQLGSFEFIKPSGLPQGQITEEDLTYSVVNGGDFEFTGDQGAFRYIRFKTIATYASSGPIGQIVVSEISFWGKIEL
ncbi:DUF4959 domain-containing protein [Niabella aurantiaca]|uniref:DUF4959 domain-containing protein n=1 Tax=Niabella aurantiaca TaxID=379900 RepID=UPI00037FB999|nr:DUF4959 domain-containing protein [Niabella aurantiaca]